MKIATVPYSNAWPLTAFLAEGLPGATITSMFPSQMLPLLTSREIDLVLMPVIELMYLPDGYILGNGCVSCRGEVQSVLLYSKCPLPDIKTLALDASSRSSITLAGVLLRSFYNCSPQTVPLPSQMSAVEIEACESDAFVLIGDRALAFEPSSPCWLYRYDLGELWHRHTGLPFVFAAWIACTEQSDQLIDTLNAVRDKGVAEMESIIQRIQSEELPIPPDRMLHYLRHNIHYHLGQQEQAGMNEFFDRAFAVGLIPQRRVV